MVVGMPIIGAILWLVEQRVVTSTARPCDRAFFRWLVLMVAAFGACAIGAGGDGSSDGCHPIVG